MTVASIPLLKQKTAQGNLPALPKNLPATASMNNPNGRLQVPYVVGKNHTENGS